jgi:hypothetical protein
MSDEFDSGSDNNHSSFWPLLILTSGLIIWFGVGDYQLNKQRSSFDQQFQAALPTITEAQNVSTRYVALMKDLVQTSAKDEIAAKIVKDAIQAGLIHVQPNATNGAGTPAAPSK